VFLGVVVVLVIKPGSHACQVCALPDVEGAGGDKTLDLSLTNKEKLVSNGE
jgi:hypothetical protein